MAYSPTLFPFYTGGSFLSLLYFHILSSSFYSHSFLLVLYTILQNHLILSSPVGLFPLNFISNTLLSILFVPKLCMWSDHCIYFFFNSVTFVFILHNPLSVRIYNWADQCNIWDTVSLTESVLIRYCCTVHFKCSSVLKWSLNKTLFFILRIHLSSQTLSFL
jgi:hypothetical protein